MLIFWVFLSMFLCFYIFIGVRPPKVLGRFLSNIYDPKCLNAERYLTYSTHVMQSGGAAMKQEWQHHIAWIKENMIGPPKATKAYSVKELQLMHMVGVYSK